MTGRDGEWHPVDVMDRPRDHSPESPTSQMSWNLRWDWKTGNFLVSNMLGGFRVKGKMILSWREMKKAVALLSPGIVAGEPQRPNMPLDGV